MPVVDLFRWLEGENATPDRIADPAQAASDLAGFISALQGVDPAGGPSPDGRGGPLAPRESGHASRSLPWPTRSTSHR